MLHRKFVENDQILPSSLFVKASLLFLLEAISHILTTFLLMNGYEPRQRLILRLYHSNKAFCCSLAESVSFLILSKAINLSL